MKAIRPAAARTTLALAAFTLAALILGAIGPAGARAADPLDWRACLPDDWVMVVVASDAVEAEAALARAVGVAAEGADYEGAVQRVLASLKLADLPLSDGELIVGYARSGADESYPFAMLPTRDFEQLAESMRGEVTGDLAVGAVLDVEVILAPCGDWALVMAFEQVAQAQAVVERGHAPRVHDANGRPPYLAVEFSHPGLAYLDERAARISRRSRTFALRDMLRWPPTFRALEAAVGQNRPLLKFAAERTNGLQARITPRDAGGVTVAVSAPLKPTAAPTDPPGRRAVLPDAVVAESVARLTGDGQSGLAGLLAKALLAYSEGRPDEIDAKRYEPAAYAGYREATLRTLAHVVGFDAVRRDRHAGNDALESNHAVLLVVDDPVAFEQGVEETFLAWNEVVKSSQAQIRVRFEPSREQAAGREFATFGVDMVEAIRAGAAPEVRQLMSRLFGDGGRYAWRLARVGESRFLLTDTPPKEAAELATMVESLPAGEPRADATGWTAQVPLDRYFAWRSVVRKVSEGRVVGRREPPPMPEQEIKARAALDDNTLELEITAPAEAAQALGKFWLRVR